MIKKLLLTTSIAVLGFADSSATVKSAMKDYKNKEYAKALEKFNTLSTFQASSAVDFYIGRSHYELGNYEKALIAYDRFLINNPNHKRAKLEVAQTYFMLKMYDEALPRFQALMNDPELPQVVKQNIQIRIGAIESKTTKHNYQATAIFGLGYDDNIDNSTDASNADVYIPIIDPNAPVTITPGKSRDSFFHEAGLMLSHVYSHNESYALQNSATLYHQGYERDSSKETSLVSLSTAPVMRYNDTNIKLGFGYDHVWYDSSSYMDVFHFTPSISKGIGANKLYYGALKIAKKEFASEYEDQDSMQYDLTNRLMMQTEDYGIFGFDLILGKEERKRSTNNGISKDYYTFKLSNTYPLTGKLNLKSSLDFTDTDYKHKDPGMSKREDDKFNLGLNLGYKYNTSTTVGLSYNYIDQNSYHNINDYDKSIAKTYLYYTF